MDEVRTYLVIIQAGIDHDIQQQRSGKVTDTRKARGESEDPCLMTERHDTDSSQAVYSTF